MGLAALVHPGDEDLKVLQALVAVGGRLAVLALEGFDHLGGDVTNRVETKGGFELLHGPDDRLVIAFAAVELNPLEVGGDDVTQARVATAAGGEAAVGLAEFAPATGGSLEAADVCFVLALEGVLSLFTRGLGGIGEPPVDEPGAFYGWMFFNGHG